ncbi:Carboxypeptidase [Citrus sinensis]|nr:Carboxypeptidase [Citrus sinensis]
MASSTLFHTNFTFFFIASSFSNAAYPSNKSNELNFNCIFMKATSRNAHKRLILFPKTSITIASVDDQTLDKLVKKKYPENSVQEFGHHAGYYQASSSELVLLYENGPVHNANDLSLVWNDCSSDKAFFVEHPCYDKNDFYITGESYAGHYIPAFAFPNEAYPECAWNMRLIKQSDYESINNKLMPKWEHAIKTCRIYGGQACLFAFYFYEHIFQKIIGIVGHVNHYDIKKKCIGRYCFDLSNIEKLLNETLDGIRVLIYTAEYDLVCNWVDKPYFIAAPTIPFKVDGDKAKQMKNHKPLTFLNQVHDASDMVFMDQLKVSLKMLQSWM